MKIQELEVKVDSAEAMKLLAELTKITNKYIDAVEKLSNIEIAVNVVEKIPKKWYQFWVKNN